MAFCALMREDPAGAFSAPRPRTRIETRGSHRQEAVHQVVVHALSLDGLIVESRDSFSEGARVIFEIGEIGECFATILWRDGSLYDCQFERRLDPYKVHRKLLRAPVAWGALGAGSDGPWSARDSAGRPIGARFPEPVIDPWSGWVRVTLLVAGAILCWLPPIALLLGWRP
jgi:hypothetical protein